MSLKEELQVRTDVDKRVRFPRPRGEDARPWGVSIEQESVASFENVETGQPEKEKRTLTSSIETSSGGSLSLISRGTMVKARM